MKARVSTEPPFEDLRIVTTDTIDDPTRSAALATVAELTTRLGVKICVFHAEFWITEQGPQLCDFMTRPGGGFIPEMVKAKCGIDLRAAHVYACFGMVDDVANLARKANWSTDQVAVGSLGEPDASADAASAAQNWNALAKKKDVIAYSLVAEFSNSVVGSNNSRGALCVSGSDSSSAVALLDKIAADCNLR